VRVGDRERERTQRRLRRGYLRGELSDETFEARMAAALRARRAADLAALHSDLPTPHNWLRRTVGSYVAATRGGAGDPRPVLVAPEAAPGSRLLLGRGSECFVRFAEPSVSRRHAELRRAPAGWLLVDRGSTNGTWVNGVRVGRSYVADGDEICLGDACVVLRS
jgi:hypothetical protein